MAKDKAEKAGEKPPATVAAPAAATKPADADIGTGTEKPQKLFDNSKPADPDSKDGPGGFSPRHILNAGAIRVQIGVDWSLGCAAKDDGTRLTRDEVETPPVDFIGPALMILSNREYLALCCLTGADGRDPMDEDEAAKVVFPGMAVKAAVSRLQTVWAATQIKLGKAIALAIRDFPGSASGPFGGIPAVLAGVPFNAKTGREGAERVADTIKEALAAKFPGVTFETFGADTIQEVRRRMAAGECPVHGADCPDRKPKDGQATKPPVTPRPGGPGAEPPAAQPAVEVARPGAPTAVDLPSPAGTEPAAAAVPPLPGQVGVPSTIPDPGAN